MGDFRINGSLIRGNSTVFDGNIVETATARSVIQLSRVQVALAPQSRARVYGDHTVLEKGTGLLRGNETHVFQAASMEIVPAAKDSAVQVALEGTSRISVFAISGAAQVRNSSGLLLARLRGGMALEFDAPPQTGGSAAVQLTGLLTLRDGIFFLTDATTQVTAELRGADLAKYVGTTITISGSIIPGAAPAPGASEVVQVTSKHRAGGGLSAGAKIAIIGGVAIAGTIGGLAAAGTFSSGPSSSNP
jgi:hypothetical protein